MFQQARCIYYFCLMAFCVSGQVCFSSEGITKKGNYRKAPCPLTQASRSSEGNSNNSNIKNLNDPASLRHKYFHMTTSSDSEEKKQSNKLSPSVGSLPSANDFFSFFFRKSGGS